MKSQEHNTGELKDLSVKIEKDVVEAFEVMVKNTGHDMAELVVIAMKRFRASHSDFEKSNFGGD
jgi:hypothetical protein